jgi:hypothetical protein
MIRLTVLFLVFFSQANAFCQDSCHEWDQKSGPIPIINQAPIQLLFLQATPDRAETLPKGGYSLSLHAAETNTLLWGKSERYYGYIDMEMMRASLGVRYGLLSGLEVGISVPFLYTYPGFMDHGIHEFEELVHRTRNLRDKEDQGKWANAYTYFVKKDNQTFIAGKEGSSGMGDVVFTLKRKIRDEEDALPCVSGRLAVKLPTGDEEMAFGSGEADYGLGLLLEKDIWSLTTYLNLDVIVPGHAFEGIGVPLRHFYEVMLASEYRVSSRTSLLAQLTCLTRPFRHTGLEMLDKRIIDLLLGITYLRESGLLIQGGIKEDFRGSSDAGADISLFLIVGKRM